MHAQKKKSWSHLWMSLTKQWEVYDIIKSAVEGMSLKPLADEVGSAQAALGMRPVVQQLSKEKYQWDWAASWTSCSFTEQVLLERDTDRQTVGFQTWYLTDISCKVSEVSL